jgi:hypothetical protein
MRNNIAGFCARVAALFVTRSTSLADRKKLADTKEVFESLPKPKASVPSSLGMVRKW